MTPICITSQKADRVEVQVHPVVRTLTGQPIVDDKVLHLYTFAGGLMERMDLDGQDNRAFSPQP